MENTNYSLQEKIQSFVTGDLDEAARRSLLDQSISDTDTADELAFGQSLARALKHSEITAAASILSTVIAAEGFPPPPSTTPSFWPKWIGLSVVVIMIATAGYFLAESYNLFISESQKIGQSALSPLENVLYLPVDGTGIKDLQTGMIAYDAGRYAEAARSLAAYTALRPDPTAKVYLGVSYLLAGKSEQAIAPLTEATTSPEPPVQEAAFWYLTLAYLAENQPDEARNTLRNIPIDGLFGEKARALGEQLK